MVQSLKSMISGLSNTSSVYQQKSSTLNKSKQFDFDVSTDLNETKVNFRSTNRNFSMNVPKPYNNMMPRKPFKDPDIWDPPELQLQKNKSRPKIVQQPGSRAGKNFTINKTNKIGSANKIKK